MSRQQAVKLPQKILNVSPVVKWAGGKTQLLNKFDCHFPASYGTYYEPFLGGGAVFFHIQPEKAIISDLNQELIQMYEVIRDRADELILILQEYKQKHSKKFYYEIREKEPTNKVEKAARFIYLNKACYNGLMRYNRKGKFNTPWGGYRTLSIDENNIRNVSKLLKSHRIKILHCDFEKALETATKGDFIYLDPPYQPLSKTTNITSYTKDSFSYKDQNRLANVFRELDKTKHPKPILR